MKFQVPSLQGQTPVDFALRAGLYAATGALASRVTVLTAAQGVFAGLINGLCVQLGHTALKTDNTATQEILACMAPLALSNGLMTALSSRLHLPLNLSVGITLFLFNAAGEAVKTIMMGFFATPVTPEKKEEVKELSDAGIRKLHADYANQKDKIGAEALPDVHRRFYEQGLPLPEGKEFSEMRKAGEKFEITEIPVPKTVEEVEALTKNQLSWLAFSLLQHKGLSTMDFKVQVALRRVMVMEISFSFHVTPKSVDDVNALDVKKDQDIIELLHTRYTGNTLKWLETAEGVKETLNQKFQAIGKRAIPLTFNMPKQLQNLGKMTQEEFMPIYEYYDNHRDKYQNLDRLIKVEFNKKVSEFNLAPLN